MNKIGAEKISAGALIGFIIGGILLIILLAILAKLGGLYDFGEGEKTEIEIEADKFLLDFPTEIPGADRVDHYKTPNSKYVLVHIRQVHLVGGVPLEQQKESTKKQVDLVQKSIYKILVYLLQNEGLNEIFTEGEVKGEVSTLFFGDDYFLERCIDDIKRLEEKIFILESDIKEYEEGTKEFEKEVYYGDKINSKRKEISSLKGSIKEIESKLKTEESSKEAYKIYEESFGDASEKESPFGEIIKKMEYTDYVSFLEEFLEDLKSELETTETKLQELIEEKENYKIQVLEEAKSDLDNTKSALQFAIKTKQNYKNFMPLYRAVERVAIEYGLSVYGAEYLPEYYSFHLFGAGEELKKIYPGESVHDAREDAFLKGVSKLENALIVVVYGGAHAWGGKDSFGGDYPVGGGWRVGEEDNIAKWNEEHPNEKYSLVEITPTGYYD